MYLKLCMRTHPDSFNQFKCFQAYPSVVTSSCHDVIIFRFSRHFMIFAGFGKGTCLRLCRASQFFPRICILIGCINLPCLKCERLHIVELSRHYFRKFTFFSTMQICSLPCSTKPIILKFY